MDCKQCQREWESYWGEVDLSSPAAISVHNHLEGCPTCRHEFEIASQWEQRLRQVMQDVPVPADLLARLQRAVQEHTDGTTAAELPIAESRRARWFGLFDAARPGMNRRRATWKIAGMTVGAVGLAILGRWRWNQVTTPPLVLNDLASVLTDPRTDLLSLPPFRGTFEPRLPAVKELNYPVRLKQETPQGILRGEREIGALYSFRSTLNVPRPPQVYLGVFNLAYTPIADVPRAESFAQAEFLYLNERAVKMWSRDQAVYLCFAQAKGTEYLEDLTPRILPS